MPKKTPSLEEQILDLTTKLKEAQEAQRRSLADYQNLVRRQSEEMSRFIQLANQDLLIALLPALQNLSVASQALNDQGLNLVIAQFWTALKEQGVEELGSNLVDQPFDDTKMEAVDGAGETVERVLTVGFALNGHVLLPAKVVVK
ncbi:nucleotide exchange factor GrpE [Microgenomates group bacterium]|nr:nucleotide exchange factor GrpE [Microgenomates group bacterium]